MITINNNLSEDQRIYLGELLSSIYKSHLNQSYFYIYDMNYSYDKIEAHFCEIEKKLKIDNEDNNRIDIIFSIMLKNNSRFRWKISCGVHIDQINYLISNGKDIEDISNEIYKDLLKIIDEKMKNRN